MRPEPLKNDRPFFRKEAEQHRLYRHLGEVVLFQPPSIRLVSLLPLAALALVGFGLLQLRLQTKYDAACYSSAANRLTLTLTREPDLQKGDRVTWQGDAQKTRGTATVVALRRDAQPGAPHQTQLVLRLDKTPLTPIAPATALKLWGEPQPFLPFFGDQPVRN